MTTATPVQKILERLEGVQGRGPWMARCPAHHDRAASLRITEKPDGRVIFHCHAGCGGADVIEALDLHFSDLKPEGCTLAGPSPVERSASESLRSVAHAALVAATVLGNVARSGRCSEAQADLAVRLANEIQRALDAAGIKAAVLSERRKST